MAKIKLGGNLISDPEKMEALTRAETYEQARWWVQYKNRVDAYPTIGEQLDMQYHDRIDGTTTWKDAIDKVKADNSIEAEDVQAELAKPGGTMIDSEGLPYDSDNYNSRAEEDEAGMPQRGDDDTDEDIRNGTTYEKK